MGGGGITHNTGEDARGGTAVVTEGAHEGPGRKRCEMYVKMPGRGREAGGSRATDQHHRRRCWVGAAEGSVGMHGASRMHAEPMQSREGRRHLRGAQQSERHQNSEVESGRGGSHTMLMALPLPLCPTHPMSGSSALRTSAYSVASWA